MKNLTNSRCNVKVLWGHLSVSVEARFEGINSICISYILRKIIPSSNGRWKELLGELGWETLQERRSKHKLIIFYKILNGLTPEYLSALMPPLVSDTNPYNLRNSDNVQSFRARTNIFSNSFFPSTIIQVLTLLLDVVHSLTCQYAFSDMDSKLGLRTRYEV